MVWTLFWVDQVTIISSFAFFATVNRCGIKVRSSMTDWFMSGAGHCQQIRDLYFLRSVSAMKIPKRRYTPPHTPHTHTYTRREIVRQIWFGVLSEIVWYYSYRFQLTLFRNYSNCYFVNIHISVIISIEIAFCNAQWNRSLVDLNNQTNFCPIKFPSIDSKRLYVRLILLLWWWEVSSYGFNFRCSCMNEGRFLTEIWPPLS